MIAQCFSKTSNYSIKACLNLLMLLTLTFLTCHLNAGEVYKWVDENGMIHFSDKKPNFTESESVKVSSSKGRSAKAPDPVGKAAELANKQQEKKDLQAQQKAEAAQRKELEEKCESIRANLKTFAENARIRVNEDGNLRFLTPEEIDSKKKKHEEMLAKHCQ